MRSEERALPMSSTRNHYLTFLAFSPDLITLSQLAVMFNGMLAKSLGCLPVAKQVLGKWG